MSVGMNHRTKFVLYRARVDSWKDSICKIYIDRATESSYWINGRRHPRKSEPANLHQAENHFETLKLAQDWLDERLNYLRDVFQKQANDLQAKRDRVRMLTENDIQFEKD